MTTQEELEEQIREGIRKSKKLENEDIKPSKVIEIRHTGVSGGKESSSEETGETIREERDTLRNQLGTIALKAFEDDKKNLLASVPEDRKEAIDNFIGVDPAKLEQLKGQQLISGNKPYDWDENPEDIQRPPPKGKIGGLPTGNQNLDAKSILDSAYKVLEQPNPDPEAFEKATSVVNKMFNSMLKGRRKAVLSGQERYGLQFSQCPSCKELIVQPRDGEDFTSCSKCGWKQKVKRRR